MVAGLSSSLTHQVASHGVYATFALMAIDAILPARQRTRHALCRCGSRRRDHHTARSTRNEDQLRAWCLSRCRDRRHARLPRGRDNRMGDRPRRRTAAPRATATGSISHQNASTAPSSGSSVGVSRSVLLGRNVPVISRSSRSLPASSGWFPRPLHPAHAHRLGYLVVRPLAAPDTPSAPDTAISTTRSTTGVRGGRRRDRDGCDGRDPSTRSH